MHIEINRLEYLLRYFWVMEKRRTPVEREPVLLNQSGPAPYRIRLLDYEYLEARFWQLQGAAESARTGTHYYRVVLHANTRVSCFN